METIKFKIQLSVKDLYYFMMFHYYDKLSGIFGIVLSIAAAVVLVMNFSEMGDTERLFFLIIALLFTVINPILMLIKARSQIISNKSLGGELTYYLDDSQISIRMGGEKADIKWEQVARVKDNGRELVVYVTAARGYIWPKRQIADQYDQIIAALKGHVDESRLRLKREKKK